MATVIDDDDESDTVSMTSVNSDTRGESPSHAPVTHPLSNQARLRAELDRSRLCQQRWLLQGREEEVGLETVLADADEALTLAREAAERRQQLLEEEERQQRLEEEQRYVSLYTAHWTLVEICHRTKNCYYFCWMKLISSPQVCWHRCIILSKPQQVYQDHRTAASLGGRTSPV